MLRSSQYRAFAIEVIGRKEGPGAAVSSPRNDGESMLFCTSRARLDNGSTES